MDNLLKALQDNEVIGRHKYESLKLYKFNNSQNFNQLLC